MAYITGGGTDWSKYETKTFKERDYDTAVSNEYETIIEETGKGFLELAYAQGSTSPTIKITIDGNSYEYSETGSSYCCGIINQDSILRASEGSNDLVYLMNVGGGIPAGISPDSRIKEFPITTPSPYGVSIIKDRIPYNSNLKIEVKNLSSSGILVFYKKKV